ncbi:MULTISPECIES: isochorismatase family protein [unclassified Corynebacterium]|uniref:isochorismatase family protein n=1 Tax=Corynebacterium TaxID=1716 RepID=UPI00254E7C8E|nr:MULTISPECIES: isochorismatase family protein [unclassified Corynebacterium]MDK8466669.1 isochorismatase family protein [Corynebacterium sp. MSK130]MDK8476741.1 isochorismatase family protein [Corynebacterium sp. MSK310]MDK8491021.1 isochorismatase family protein [Corynebacterium sp. MSK175]MDK8671601.1 isochorismatase family protein [Corynebacterium sp. MSK189]MDK8687243.1 isochorismatase family protein [Corynebacterium sp. MSK122]
MNTALIIVDVQHDFCPGGALGTDRGNEVAEKISSLQTEYDTVVATQDWHIDPGSHFAENPDFVDSWPVHCVADSYGAQMHEAIGPAQAYFRKGEYTAAYSGFEGEADGVLLADWLREHAIDAVDIVGIATDHCVQATAADALKEGFSVRVLSEYCSPVDPDRGDAALAKLRKAGATIV